MNIKIVNPFKYRWYNEGSKYIYLSILLITILSVLGLLNRFVLSSVNLMPSSISYLFQIISIYFLSKGISKNYSISYFRGKYLQFVLILIFTWLVINLIFSLPQVASAADNFLNLKQFLKGVLLLYIIPFLMFVKPDLVLLNRFLKLGFVLNIIFLIIVIPLIFIESGNIEMPIENYIRSYASAGVLVLLTVTYHSKRVNRIVWLTLILAFTIMALQARRNQVLFIGSVFFFYSIILIFTNTSTLKNQRIRTILSSLLILLFTLFMYFLLNIDFSYLSERIDTGFDSREGVAIDFINDFNQNNDWLLGRGITGEFKSKHLADNYFTGTRDLIEIGYFHLVLKKGLLYTVLFVLVSLIAFYKGFFKSNNILSKAAASIVAINLVDMVGYGLPSITLKYAFIFISIAICLSYEIRNLSDSFLKRSIGLK